jgi:hypothetical protein
MKHIVSLSGGTASAVAADRVMARSKDPESPHYGEEVVLWFADTKWEDHDLYRFLNELETYWDHPVIRESDGRTPLEVASDRSIIPNNRFAPCSLVLKQQMFKKFLKAQEKPVTVHLGLDWSEEHRHARPKMEYEKVEGVSVDFLLMWKPLMAMNAYHAYVEDEFGIDRPHLYKAGFPHNNCGGRCIRQGQKEWLRLLKTHPERFHEVAEWEQEQREKGGPRANRTIMVDRRDGESKAITLYELKARDGVAPEQVKFDGAADMYGCFCDA